MCGLFGMMGPGISQKDIKFIRDLAYVSGLRGTDGTGVLQGVSYKKASSGFLYTVNKMPSEVSYYLWFNSRSKEGEKDILDSVTDTFMAGHVRAATRGANSKENSHPFELKNLVGMHNGTLYDKKYEHAIKTDSELMFMDIEKRGLVSVLGGLDSKSAYAIVMLNLKTGEFTFARNEHRPLACAWNEKRKVFYWASEYLMLDFIAKRNDIEVDKVWSFSTDTLHTFRPYDVEIGRRPNWRLQKIPKVVSVTPEKDKEKSGFQNLPLPWRESMEAGSNVIALPIPDRTKDKTQSKVKREQLCKRCLSCNCLMDPLDQFQGRETEPNKYVCKKCDDLSESLVASKSIN